MIFVGSDRSSLCYVHCTMHIVLYCTLLCTANCSEGILPYENRAFGTKLIYWGGKCWNGRLNFAFTMISDQWWFCPAMYVEKSYVSWESIWFLFCGYTLHNKIQLHRVLRFCEAWDLVLYWSWSRILHNQILLHYVGRPCVVLAEIYFVLSFYIDRSQIQFLRALFEHASSNYTFDKFSWIVLICDLKSVSWLAWSSHRSHSNLYVFSPLCTFMCRVRWAVRLNAESHWLHLYGLAPLCTFMCFLRYSALLGE